MTYLLIAGAILALTIVNIAAAFLFISWGLAKEEEDAE